MDRPTRIVFSGVIAGLILFIGFSLMTFANITPFGSAFNNFFIMLGIILSFISGFFLLSLKTAKY
jgi:hypothetical protein